MREKHEIALKNIFIYNHPFFFTLMGQFRPAGLRGGSSFSVSPTLTAVIVIQTRQ